MGNLRYALPKHLIDRLLVSSQGADEESLRRDSLLAYCMRYNGPERPWVSSWSELAHWYRESPGEEERKLTCDRRTDTSASSYPPPRRGLRLCADRGNQEVIDRDEWHNQILQEIIQKLESATLPLPRFKIRRTTSPESDLNLFPELLELNWAPVIEQEIVDAAQNYATGIERLGRHYEVRKVKEHQQWIDLLSNGGDALPGLEEQVRALRQIRKQIMQLANGAPKQPLEIVQEALYRFARRKRELSFMDCLELFVRGEGSELLRKLLAGYLIGFTHLQHQRRLIRSAEEADSPADLKKLHKLCHCQRGYSPDPKDPVARVILVIEKQLDIRLRPEQIELIRELMRKEEGSHSYQPIVAQMIMGGGKSKVILPAISLLHDFSIFIVPDSLASIQANDLFRQARRILGRRVHQLTFTREMGLDRTALTDCWNLVKKAQEERGALVVTPRTMATIQLSLIDQLNGVKDEECIRLLKSILLLFRYRGHALCDEVDSVLDIRREQHFANGDPIHLRADKISLMIQGYRILLDLGYNPRELVSKEAFSELAKPLLRRWLRFPSLRLLSSRDRRRVRDHILACMHQRKVEALPLIEERLASDEVEIKRSAELLLEIREQLMYILSHTLAAKPSVEYGLSYETEREYAIPFAGNRNPVEPAELAHELETINCTIQWVLAHGLTDKQAKQLYHTWWNRVLREIGRRTLQGAEETEAWQEFSSTFGRTLHQLSSNKPEDLAYIRKVYLQHPEWLLDYLEKHILTTISTFLEESDFYAPNLVDMFCSFQGITGTPWNGGSYHQKLRVLRDEGVEGQIVAKLLDSGSPVITVASREVDTFLDPIFDQLPSLNAIIDVAAHFQGLPNVEIAEAICSAYRRRGIAIDGVLYFADEGLACLTTDRKRIALRGSGSKALEEAGLSSNRLVTYYDQINTTGRDIPQAPDAWAVVTVDDRTFQRDLLQGAFRMRGLLDRQQVAFALTAASRQRIAAALDLDEGAILSFRDIYQSALVSQAGRVGEDNFRAFRRKVDHLLRQHALNWVLEAGCGTSQMIGRFEIPEVRALFIKRNTLSAADRYGHASAQQNPKEYIRNQLLPETLRRANQLAKHTGGQSQLRRAVKELMQSALEEKLFLRQVETRSTLRLGQQVQRQVERQSETEVEQEQVKFRESVAYRPHDDPISWGDFQIYKDSLRDYAGSHFLPAAQVVAGLMPELNPDEIQAIYGDRLVISRNYLRVAQQNRPFLFGQQAKPIQFLLNWKDEGRVNMMILDQREAVDMKRRLVKQRIARTEIGVIGLDGRPIQLGRSTALRRISDPRLLLLARHLAGDVARLEEGDFSDSYKAWLAEEEELRDLKERIFHRAKGRSL